MMSSRDSTVASALVKHLEFGEEFNLYLQLVSRESAAKQEFIGVRLQSDDISQQDLEFYFLQC